MTKHLLLTVEVDEAEFIDHNRKRRVQGREEQTLIEIVDNYAGIGLLGKMFPAVKVEEISNDVPTS